MFSSLFRCLFGSIFARFSTPTCLPKSTKIAQKSMPRCLPMLNSFFDRFLIDFCSQLGPPEPKKSSPRCRESTIFQKIAFRKWHRFLIDLGANMAPFWLPKSSQILPKIDPKMHQIFDRFLHRFFLHFGSILGPKLGPRWPHFPLTWGNAVGRRPPFLLGLCYFLVFWSSWPPLGPISARFWRVWASILEVFGLHFGGFWSRFGSHVACNFGTF